MNLLHSVLTDEMLGNVLVCLACFVSFGETSSPVISIVRLLF
jgi:hypothetical protein